jgi:hypothetical protein
MTAIWIAWGVSFVALVALAVALSFFMKPPEVPLGILVDTRGRYSLTHFQLTMWTIVILSLISGLFFGRWIAGVDHPLEFAIPAHVLGLLGITVGSAAAAVVVKTTKDHTNPGNVTASGPSDPPRFAQIFLVEEGQYADKVVDITKYQNCVITMVLVAAYIGLSIHFIASAGGPASTGLPDFSGTFLLLVGISQGGYVAAKVPNKAGPTPGLTVLNASMPPLDLVPRNPATLQGQINTLLAAQRPVTIARRALAISQSPAAQGQTPDWLTAEAEIDAQRIPVLQRVAQLVAAGQPGNATDILMLAESDARAAGQLTAW